MSPVLIGAGGMQMAELSTATAAIWVVLSFAVLIAALLVTNIYAPIRF